MVTMVGSAARARKEVSDRRTRSRNVVAGENISDAVFIVDTEVAELLLVATRERELSID